MKNLITAVAFMLLSVATTAASKPLTIEGKFINAHKHVTYDLYVMQSDSTYKLISSQTGSRYFSVQVNSGATYLMRFTCEQGDSSVVKFLLINPVKKDDFAVKIDFSNENSAELYWHTQAGSYQIRPYEPGVLRLAPTGVARQ